MMSCRCSSRHRKLRIVHPGLLTPLLVYATIGAAVGMGRKTVQKHIGLLVDKELIRAEETMIRRKDGRRCNGSLLYTVKPIQQILREREEELLAELKLAEVQRKWDRRCQQRDRPRSAL